MTRKPNRVRCWMITRHFPYQISWIVMKERDTDIARNSYLNHIITPGHFVPEVKKARRE